MQIVIQIADTESARAVAMVEAVAVATMQHDVNFSGDTISVESGDFTCLSEGEGHSDAARLFGLVQQTIEDARTGEAWETDGPYTLVPKSEGGFAKLLTSALHGI